MKQIEISRFKATFASPRLALDVCPGAFDESIRTHTAVGEIKADSLVVTSPPDEIVRLRSRAFRQNANDVPRCPRSGATATRGLRGWFCHDSRASEIWSKSAGFSIGTAP